MPPEKDINLMIKMHLRVFCITTQNQTLSGHCMHDTAKCMGVAILLVCC